MLKSRVAPEHADAVGVDHRDRLAQRVERVGGIIFRSEQALFLGGDGEEDDRALGARRLGEGAGLLDDVRDAGRIVERAIIDAVAIGVGQADAEMVMVRGVDDRLVGPLGPGKPADDIVGGDDLGLGGRRRVEAGLEVDRAEILAPGGGLGRVEIEAGGLEQGDRRVALDPAFERRCARPPGSARTMSNMVLVFEFLTVSQP